MGLCLSEKLEEHSEDVSHNGKVSIKCFFSDVHVMNDGRILSERSVSVKASVRFLDGPRLSSWKSYRSRDSEGSSHQ